MSQVDLPEPSFGPLPLYPNAPHSVIAAWRRRRRALVFAEGETLPALDVNLDALREQIVTAPQPPNPKASSFAKKSYEIRNGFVGQSELCALNGLLIATLRKRKFPDHSRQLFHRLWQEQSDFLLAHLNTRWLISSIITFGDHGKTEAERRLGLAMNVLMSVMKLYEYERLYSGLRADQAFGIGQRAAGGLPLDMPSFSLVDGGLDLNMLAPIWRMACDVAVAGPIAQKLLDCLNLEERGLLRRLDGMRDAMMDAAADRKRALVPPEPPQTAQTAPQLDQKP